MSKSIKLVLLLAGGLLAGYLGSTFWIGTVVEKEWRHQALELSTQTPGLEISVLAYEKAFFSAAVTTEIKLTMLDEEPLAMTLVSSAQHGPLLFSNGSPQLLLVQVDTALGAVSGAWREVFEKVPELQQLAFSEQVELNLDYSGAGGLPAFERVFDENSNPMQLRFDGLMVRYSGSMKAIKSLQATITMPGAALFADEFNLEMQNASAQVDMREVLPSIFAGTSNIKIGALEIAGIDAEDPVQVALNGLEAGAVIDIANGMLEEVVSYRIDQLDVNGDLYGPAVFELALSNLDAEVMAQVQSNLQQAQLASMQQSSSDMIEQYLVSLKQNLLPLVKKSPKLEIRRLDVQTPFGHFSSKGQMQIDGEQVIGIDPPMLLIAALTADAELQIDKTLLHKAATEYMLQSLQEQTTDVSVEVLEMRAVQQANQTIDGLVAANLLIDSGDSYRLQARFDRGSSFVNGKQM